MSPDFTTKLAVVSQFEKWRGLGQDFLGERTARSDAGCRAGCAPSQKTRRYWGYGFI
jgi:hypothetical protein